MTENKERLSVLKPAHIGLIRQCDQRLVISLELKLLRVKKNVRLKGLVPPKMIFHSFIVHHFVDSLWLWWHFLIQVAVLEFHNWTEFHPMNKYSGYVVQKTNDGRKISPYRCHGVIQAVQFLSKYWRLHHFSSHNIRTNWTAGYSGHLDTTAGARWRHVLLLLLFLLLGAWPLVLVHSVEFFWSIKLQNGCSSSKRVKDDFWVNYPFNTSNG